MESFDFGDATQSQTDKISKSIFWNPTTFVWNIFL